MTFGNLEILEMDKKLLPTYRNIHKKALGVCKKVGAILDLATSDVCLYLYAKNKKDAQKVAKTYNSKVRFEGKNLNNKHPNLKWYNIID